jgi:GLPGLI family protein
MKRFLSTFCTLLLTVMVYAQQTYPAIIKVQYNFIHVRDTTQRDKPYTETMMLLVGKDASMYTSFDRIDQIVDLQIKGQENRKNGISFTSMSGRKPVSNGYFYLFPHAHKFISYEQMHVNYLVEGEIEKIDWKILKDTLSFSGIRAQKATATYKGRNWVAWFAPELPFTNGPWKLNGLPGLIVEAYDDKNEVQFRFAGVEKVKSGDLAVDKARELPEPFLKSIRDINVSEITVLPEGPLNHGGPVKITKAEYDKLKAQQDKDPIGFMTAQFAAIGIKNPGEMAQSVANGTAPGGGGGFGNGGGEKVQVQEKAPAPVKNPVNNPIELSPKM